MTHSLFAQAQYLLRAELASIVGGLSPVNPQTVTALLGSSPTNPLSALGSVPGLTPGILPGGLLLNPANGGQIVDYQIQVIERALKGKEEP